MTSVVVSCPVCDADARLYGAKAGDGEVWTLHQCPSCGHGFVSNRPTRERLKDIYSKRPYYELRAPAAGEYEQRNDCRVLVGRLAGLASARGRALDVGSGDGGFSFYLAKAGFQPFMIDWDPRAKDIAQRIPGSTFVSCGFEELEEGGPFSAVLMSQVLEHALDPIAWLRKARNLLAPGGVLALAVPNFAGVYRILGMRDPFITPPIHLNFFSPTSLSKAFEKAGLETIRMKSVSDVIVDHPTRKLSWRRRMAGRVWNVISLPLNFTARGIILQGYARLGG